ncbi:MAG: hypothetical protein ACXACI_12120 [Candidatus Hodarchaeales archaeon]|jgi:hypothetical protein
MMETDFVSLALFVIFLGIIIFGLIFGRLRPWRHRIDIAEQRQEAKIEGEFGLRSRFF